MTVSASSGPTSMCARASAEAIPSATPTGCIMAACIQRWIVSRPRPELFAVVMVAPIQGSEVRGRKSATYAFALTSDL